MTMLDERSVVVTREKLRYLEERYEINRNDVDGNLRIRQLNMTSLKRLINQLKEEIARYECRLRETAKSAS
jgi:ABC-type Zn uptake system ZnuABC Zn-binding protein ZnuA